MSTALLRTKVFVVAVAAVGIAIPLASAGDPAPPLKGQTPVVKRTTEPPPEQFPTEVAPEQPCPNCVPILAGLLGPLPPLPAIPKPSLKVLAPMGRLCSFNSEPPTRYHHSQFHPVPVRPVFEPRTPTGPAVVSVAQLPPRPVPSPLAPIPATQEEPVEAPAVLPDVLPEWPSSTPPPKAIENDPPPPPEPLLSPLPSTSEEPVAPKPEQLSPGVQTGYLEKVAPSRRKPRDGWVSVVHKE